MAAPSSNPVQAAFADAINSFKSELGSDQVYQDVMTAVIYKGIYETMKQEDVKRIELFTDYIDAYLQYIKVYWVKNTEIRHVIRGAITRLLQTYKSKGSFDAILTAMVDLTTHLPGVEQIATLLNQSPDRKPAISVLFYRDILSFLLVALRFAMLPGAEFNSALLWSKYRQMINIIFMHIPDHVSLMGKEVSLEHVQQEHDDLQSSLRSFELEKRKQDALEFYRIKMAAMPDSQHDGRDLLRRPVDPDSLRWLQKDKVFKNWLRPNPKNPPPILRLEGEPGTGKTYITSDIIRQLQSMGPTGFAFIRYKYHSITTALSVIHALTFSLACGSDDLETVVRESSREKDKTTLSWAADILRKLIERIGPTFLVVDGLHEMDEVQRGRLVLELVGIQRSTSNARILISCRPEPNLLRNIGRYTTDLQVDGRNSGRIQAFVKKWAESWFAERCFGGEEKAEIEVRLEEIISKSQGVFSYAKIALNSIKLLYDFSDTRKEFDKDESGIKCRNESRSNTGNGDCIKGMSRLRTKRKSTDSFQRTAPKRSKRARLKNVAKQDEHASNDDNDNSNSSSGNSTSVSDPKNKTASTAVTYLQARNLKLNFYPQLAAASQSPYPKLPGSLNEAYGEVLNKINNFRDHSSREDARLILGWIGCSPKSLTVQEIQQLLAINLEAPGHLGAVRENLDLAQICGPLVEVVDDHVHFVHFTVKEFIFSDRTPGFIDLQTATLDLTLRCIAYLCQDHHNLTLSDEQVINNVISGAYTLDWFATNMWPQLAKRYLNSTVRDELQSRLAFRLEVLYSTRSQLIQGNTNELTLDSSDFQETYPSAYALISQALRFQEICAANEQHICQEGDWTHLNPLTTSASTIRIYEEIECLLTNNKENGESSQHLLEKWYGQRPYKCPYLSCPFSRTGFQTEPQRLSHVEHHNRPWKCSVSECEFSRRGFLSEEMAKCHYNDAHPAPRPELIPTFQPAHWSDPLSLLQMARIGSVSELSNLLHLIPNEESNGAYNDDWKTRMCRRAAYSESLPMLKLCVSTFWAASQRQGNLPVSLPIAAAVVNDNGEMLKYLLTLLPEDRSETRALLWGIRKAIEDQQYEAIDAFSDFIKARPWDQTQCHDDHGFSEVLKEGQLIDLTSNDKTSENLLIDLWRSIRWRKSVTEQTKAQYYSALLMNVAESTRSVVLAEFLLKSGAMPGSGTTLRYLVRKTGSKARDLMKCLLDHGADNNIYGEDTPDEI